jgi:hypothetical protein
MDLTWLLDPRRLDLAWLPDPGIWVWYESGIVVRPMLLGSSKELSEDLKINPLD